jgi:dynein heavy chain
MMANVQTELDQALPALAKAESALEGLKKEQFQMLKALTNPPQAVKTTFIAVIHLLCTVDPKVPITKSGKCAEADPWKCTAVQLKNPQEFLDKLKNYKNEIDAGKVPEINFKAIQPILDDETF